MQPVETSGQFLFCSLTCHSFSHSFGYDSRRRSNLKLLDESTLMFIAGNLLVLLDVSTRKQRYLRSFSGGGIGAMAVRKRTLTDMFRY